jgi:UDP-glucose 4-epimerase
MKNSILLIGGTGFIGLNLANFFHRNDYNVCIVGKKNIPDCDFISDKILIKYIDVIQTDVLVELANNYVNIVWLVSNLIPSSTIFSSDEDFNSNVLPLIKFVENIRNSPLIKNFIFVSSGGTVYGNSSNFIPFKEIDKLEPISFYGLSKTISEYYINFLSKDNPFSTIIVRPSNVYGLNQNLTKHQGIIGFVLDSIIFNKSISVFDRGKAIRDFIHVDDFSLALKLMIESSNIISNCNTYNLGSNFGISISELLNLIEKITNSKISINYLPARTIDCNYNVLDTSKIKNSFNWIPEFKIKEGIQLIWNEILKKS